MEIKTYNNWITTERERNMKRDPLFKEFVEAMRALGEMPMYMNKQEAEMFEKNSDTVIRKLLADYDGPSL